MELAADIGRASTWRLAAVIAAAVAVVELVVLLAVAGIKLAPSLGHHTAAAATTPASTTPAVHRFTAKVVPLRVPATHARLRPRAHLSVLVLNGNGVAGAAGTLANRLLGEGYRRTASTNAPSQNYATSLVLYAPGYEREAHRLARDTRIRTTATGDGRLRGYRLVVILGDR